jgi:hypothetical protein
MEIAQQLSPIRITQYEALVADIEIAKANAVEAFEYRTSAGDKAARSYLFHLRKLRAKIESARKEAKAYALEYGKRVDTSAKELQEQVEGLITPHQIELDRIEEESKRQQQQVALVFADISRYSLVSMSDNSQTISDRINRLIALDTELAMDQKEAANSQKAEALENLAALCELAKTREAQARELEELREQARKRAEADREAALIAKAADDARKAAEAAAEAQRHEEARRAAHERHMIEQRAAEAAKLAEVERLEMAKRAEAAAKAQRQAEERERAAQQALLKAQQEQLAALERQKAEAEERKKQREAIITAIMARTDKLNRRQVAELIADGVLTVAGVSE